MMWHYFRGAANAQIIALARAKGPRATPRIGNHSPWLKTCATFIERIMAQESTRTAQIVASLTHILPARPLCDSIP